MKTPASVLSELFRINHIDHRINVSHTDLVLFLVLFITICITVMHFKIHH